MEKSTSYEAQTDYDAIIIGGGVSGITSAIRLKTELGLSRVLIIEKALAFGGTWNANTYPGCACDVPTRLYSISTEQQRTWSSLYAPQTEIKDYLNNVAHKHNLHDHTLFGYVGKRATFHAPSGTWHVEAQSASGEKATWSGTARVLVSGMGALSIPKKCDVPGASEFKGALFHSAQWDPTVSIEGKRVVILGNGCSSTQVIGAIAPKVAQITQIVRSKHWVSPFPKDLFKRFAALQRYVPGWTQLERFNLAMYMESHFIQSDRCYGRGSRKRYVETCQRYVRECAPREYHDMLLPDPTQIQVACKRRIFDNGYIPALCRKNVELTTDQAVRITEESVILASGREVKADVIVLATGFNPDKYILQMDIVGADGTSLEQYWAERGVPQAYRSTLVYGFPNLFLIWGPNSVTGHFSAIWSIEAAVRLMTLLLRPVFSPRALASATVCASSRAEEKEQRYIHQRMQTKIYTTGCGAWYTDPETGKVTALAPCLQHTFQRRCRNPVLADIEYKGIEGKPASYMPLKTRLGMALGRGQIPNPDKPQGALQKAKDAIGSRTLQAASWVFDQVVPWDFPEPYNRDL
ncbi:hypothetical protein EX895_004736 [Sporisorium graminicola]|uniref:FAD/NAD(P)-binding domain-containing protein n=1 Tax=Sporisorium graminicola TaxID=280036 RepID=A0A4U7KRL5_9BASI|nr:hypothetical protein EX895_004736 [Sporisorium graminicola]TKY86587.1 hypothetical protein EX895_004736 [Sporisorium graminicola]